MQVARKIWSRIGSDSRYIDRGYIGLWLRPQTSAPKLTLRPYDLDDDVAYFPRGSPIGDGSDREFSENLLASTCDGEAQRALDHLSIAETDLECCSGLHFFGDLALALGAARSMVPGDVDNLVPLAAEGRADVRENGGRGYSRMAVERMHILVKRGRGTLGIGRPYLKILRGEWAKEGEPTATVARLLEERYRVPVLLADLADAERNGRLSHVSRSPGA